ncbi:MAG: STAS domain-containing protein [Pseudomonadota bacterium]
MLIEQDRIDGFLRVECCLSRLDSVQAGTFREQLSRIISRGERAILLDLGRVDFVDSAGLGALIAVAKLVDEDGQFEITGLTGRVAQLLSLTRMDEVLSIREHA